jgi:hypothetical protein
MARYKKICSKCGSEDLTFDAAVIWNSSLNNYEIQDIWGDTWCNNCEDNTSEEDVRIIELPFNTKVL